jgi:hypothetical protein
MSDEKTTMTTLRDLWDGEGSSREQVDEACGVTQKVCRNMKHVNFDSMAEPGTDLGAAWREKLRREGKLSTSSGSLGELVFATLAGEQLPDLTLPRS